MALLDDLVLALREAGLTDVPERFGVAPVHQEIPHAVLSEIDAFVRVFNRVTSSEAWQREATTRGPPIARVRRPETCFFSAWDFHVPGGTGRLRREPIDGLLLGGGALRSVAHCVCGTKRLRRPQPLHVRDQERQAPPGVAISSRPRRRPRHPARRARASRRARPRDTRRSRGERGRARPVEGRMVLQAESRVREPRTAAGAGGRTHPPGPNAQEGSVVRRPEERTEGSARDRRGCQPVGGSSRLGLPRGALPHVRPCVAEA